MTSPVSGPVDVIDGDSLDSLLDEVAGQLNAQTGRLLDLTAWLLSHPNEWQGEGLWTANQYLAWRCGIGPALAANLVAAAERAEELPAAFDAVRAGELSFDQLMSIVRKVPAWADGQATSLVKRLTVSQARRMVARTDWGWWPGETRGDDHDAVVEKLDADEAADDTGASRPDAVSPSDVVPDTDQNRVTYGHGSDGRWFLHADLDADLGALIESSLDEARDAEFASRNRRGDGDNPKVLHTVDDVDALVELASRSYESICETSRRNRYRVNLYLDTDGQATTSHGVRLPESIARYLTCDGRIDPVFLASGRPISVGRSQRTIPDRTRRTVLHRDGHCCQVPGCTTRRGLDLHHIIHWEHDGPTDTWNLVTLCSRHHRMHHQLRLGVSGNADEAGTLVFTDARGRPIRASGARPTPPSGPPDPIRGSYEHPLGERLESRWVTFIDPAIPPDPRQQHPDIA